MWQFGELGYGYGNAGEQCLNEASYCPSIAPGRTAVKPIRWDYREEPERYALYETWANIIALRKASAAFTSPKALLINSKPLLNLFDSVMVMKK